MSAELPDSYQAIYQHAIQQMGVGESQEAIDSLLRIVKRLSRLRPETLQRKANLQRTLAGTDLGKNFVLGICIVLMALVFDNIILRWANDRRKSLGLD